MKTKILSLSKNKDFKSILTVMQRAIKIKKLAVGQVQAIHVIKSKSKRPFSFGLPTVDQLDAYRFVKIILSPLQIL